MLYVKAVLINDPMQPLGVSSTYPCTVRAIGPEDVAVFPVLDPDFLHVAIRMKPACIAVIFDLNQCDGVRRSPSADADYEVGEEPVSGWKDQPRSPSLVLRVTHPPLDGSRLVPIEELSEVLLFLVKTVWEHAIGGFIGLADPSGPRYSGGTGSSFNRDDAGLRSFNSLFQLLRLHHSCKINGATQVMLFCDNPLS